MKAEKIYFQVDYHNQKSPRNHFALIDMIKKRKFQSINGVPAQNKGGSLSNSTKLG
ncbi:unnamed protein product [Caenorhabditis brenneri]